MAPQSRKYISFREGREFVRKLGLYNRKEWKEYCMSGKKPLNIPANPHVVYNGTWIGYGDWLGSMVTSPRDKVFLLFEEARKYVHTLHLSSYNQWIEYRKSGKKPSNIPSSPPHQYKRKWVSWGNWLGTGAVAPKNRKYLPFQEARDYVHEF